MKWPEYLMLIRHDKSAYNVLKTEKRKYPLYQKFLAACRVDPCGAKTIKLAREVQKKFALRVSDCDTPLDSSEGHQAEITGKELRERFELPDVIFVSPYKRTLLTLELITKKWPELANVKTYKDERIREQEHGLALLYNDWRVFEALHPEQKMLRDQEGPYWYRYPQGENVPDVRLRNKSWTATVIREFPEKKVMAVTHHLSILATRADLERLDADEFIRLDEKEKPINCGVTLYRGNPALGKNGKLVLEFYNRKYY